MTSSRDPGPPPPRPREANKTTVGRVLVVGGSTGMAGAPFLAAYGALRAGAGLVRAAVPRAIQPVVAGYTPEVLTAGLPATRAGGLTAAALWPALTLAESCDAVLLGPGAGREAATQRLLLELARRLDVPLVMDADALFAMNAEPRALRDRRAPAVLTPHEGEAARLLGVTAHALRADRHGAAVQLARETGATIVLKGPGTLVISGRRAWRAEVGGPLLAAGGTGDVLAGVLTALLAVGGDDPFTAACRAVAWHGRAGDLLARTVERGVLAHEVADALPRTLKSWQRR